MSAITYAKEEDCDPIYDAAWDVISPYFKQDTKLTQDDILSQFPAAVPEDYTGRQSYVLVYNVLLDMAAQTPYDHPYLLKLRDLTVALIKQTNEQFRLYYPLQDYDEDLGDYAAQPDRDRYVNEQAYQALVSAQFDAGSPSKHAFYSIVKAFESKDRAVENILKAASLWMINYGGVIHRGCFNAKYDSTEELYDCTILSPYDPASPSGRKSWLKLNFQTLQARYGYRDWRESKKDSHGRVLNPFRWSLWKQGFDDMAAGRNQFIGVSNEVKTLAVRAATKMDELAGQDVPESASITSSMSEMKP